MQDREFWGGAVSGSSIQLFRIWQIDANPTGSVEILNTGEHVSSYLQYQHIPDTGWVRCHSSFPMLLITQYWDWRILYRTHSICK